MNRTVSQTATTTTTFRINGEERTVAYPTHHTLLEVLREECGLTGTKHGCELGECGTCAVLIDGRPMLSCLMLALEAEDREISTVEGMQEGNRLHPLQEALADLGGAQCGYCTPGILLTAKSLLDENPDPTTEEINEALSGNLCRCTGYLKIVEGISFAASRLRGEETEVAPETLYGAALPASATTEVDDG